MTRRISNREKDGLVLAFGLLKGLDSPFVPINLIRVGSSYIGIQYRDESVPGSLHAAKDMDSWPWLVDSDDGLRHDQPHSRLNSSEISELKLH